MSKKPTTKKTAARKPAAKPKKVKVDSWKRAYGRAFDELRTLKIESGVLPNADGSAYIEMGRNKILCGVFGPREMHPKHNAKPNEAVLRCRYHMAPFSVDPRRSPAPSRRDQEISMVMRSALEPAVFLERYPRASIDVYVEVLEADGGTRCASINAAAVALVDAGIPMRDLVAACAVGKIEDKLILDLGDYEDKKGQSDMPIAYMPKLGKVTLLQMDGEMTTEEAESALNLAIEGCKKVYEVQREALKKKYGIDQPQDKPQELPPAEPEAEPQKEEGQQ
ncbi:MAG: exosome complex exonuclease Rrp41 [Candidatus Bathyarchaeota archaeon]|nr:exosome complex exonuclease Rrp41 [Candidatus Bathyarchaeota archaeon]